VASHWELLRQGCGVLAANVLAARALVRGEMRPWELVVLVAFEAIAYTFVAWIQLLFVPPEARPEAEEKKPSLLAEVLYEVTGRRLTLAFAVGEGGADEPDGEEAPAATEEEIISLMKSTFDAKEVDETR